MKKRGNSSQNTADVITKILVAVYLLALVWILILKLGVRFSYMDQRTVNLVPFRDYFLEGKLDKIEVIMNVIIFVPAGLYAGILFRKLNFIQKALIPFVLSLGFECFQYVFRIGSFDATDIVTNTLGGWIGYFLWYILNSLLSSRLRAQKTVNLLAMLATAAMAVLLILLKLNMLPVRYQ